MFMDFENELKRYLVEENIFKRDGAHTLDRTFVPDQPRHRDAVLHKIALDFKAFLKEHKGINIAIRGDGGFGKTMISRYTQEKLTKVCLDLGINFDSRYFTCFQFRTLGAILRDYLPKNFFISGKGFSISELVAFLNQNLQREEKKLLLVIDEVQNLKPEEIMRLLVMSEEARAPGDTREFISTILIARSLDWDAILAQEPRVAQRLNTTISLEKYTFEQLVGIFSYRRDLAFKDGVLSDDNVELIAEMSELSSNVYYGMELMHHAGRLAEQQHQHEVLPEMIRQAAKYVSTEFREPVLKELKEHELLALLAIARVLERNNKENVHYTTTENAFDEYTQICEEFKGAGYKPHVITVFRKYVKKLHQSRLIRERVRNLRMKRGRRAELHMLDFPATLVIEKVTEVLKELPNEK